MKKFILGLLLLFATTVCFAGCLKDIDSDVETYELTIEEISDCYIGDVVNIPTIVVKDKEGNEVQLELTVKVTDPNGEQVASDNGSFTANVVGEYTIFASVEGGSGSWKFNCLSLKQSAVEDLAVSLSGELTFTEDEGNTYTLYRGDEKLGAITSGADVSEYIAEGINTFTVVTDEKPGYSASDRSNAATIERLAPVKDLEVNDDYILEFTEEQGVIYEFYINDDEPITFNSGDEILSYLHLGENKIYVIAKKGGAIDSAPSQEITVSASFYLPLVDVEVNEQGIITFTSEENLSYTLYVDGKEKGAIASGDSITEKFTDDDQLKTFDVQVKINGDSAHAESKLSNTARYFYNRGMFGTVAYDYVRMFNGQAQAKSKISEIYNMEEDGEGFMRFAAVGDNNGAYVEVDFDEALQANGDADRIYYLKMHVRLAPDPDGNYRGANRASFGTRTGQIAHIYDSNCRGKWIAVEIQLPVAVKSVGAFYVEIAQGISLGKTYVDVKDFSVVSYPKTTATAFGTVEVAAINTFGMQAVNFWAVPYSVAEVEENVEINGKSYDGYLKLYKQDEITFGGNAVFANQGTSCVGALIRKDFSAYSGKIDVSVTFKADKNKKVVISPYYGANVNKGEEYVFTATGEWQTVSLNLLNAKDLQGITVVSQNTAANYCETPTVCVAEISAEPSPVAPAAKDLKVAADGTVTFTGEEGYTYSLILNGEIVKENVESGEKIEIKDGNNSVVIMTAQTETLAENSTEPYMIFKFALGYAVNDKELNPQCNAAEVTYSLATVDEVVALKVDGSPVSGKSVGGAILLAEPIPTAAGKMNYAVVTFRTPDAWRGVTQMSIGANGKAAQLVHNYYSGLNESWIKAYVQLAANETSLDSVYFTLAQANSWRPTYIWISSVEVVSFDAEIQTSLGNWQVASINDFGKVSTKWSVPYTVTEVEGNYTIGQTEYTKLVRLTDDSYSFGGNTPFASNGTFNAGALMKYSFAESEGDRGILKITAKITKDVQIAVGAYYGSTVDKTGNVIVGTGDWQEIMLNVNKSGFVGITFVSLNTGSATPASVIDIAAVEEVEIVAAPAAQNFKVAPDGTVTFTAEDGYTYNFMNGETLLKENVKSGDKITLPAGQLSLTIKTIGDATHNDNYTAAFEAFNSALGFAVKDKALNPDCNVAEVGYSLATVDGIQTLKVDVAPASGKTVGGAIVLAEPIPTVAGKVNYAVVTIRTPGAWTNINQMSVGVNGKATLVVRSYANTVADLWIKAYIQISTNDAALESVYFTVAQTNSYRASNIWISSVEVESFDTQIETSLGNWQVAAINDFGKVSAKWSVPYEVSEVNEKVTIGETEYEGYVKLLDDSVSFGGNTVWASAGTYHTGALLKYTLSEGATGTVSIKLTVKITNGVNVAIGGYNGSAVDKTSNVVTGTGEWQEITITVNADNFVGITFVALKAAADTYQHPTVPASEIDIACVAEQE